MISSPPFAERLHTLAEACAAASWPSSAVATALAYLGSDGGDEAFAAAREHLAAAKADSPMSWYPLYPLYPLHDGLSASEDGLDALDLRILDLYLCVARRPEHALYFFGRNPQPARTQSAVEHLLARHTTPDQVWQYLYNQYASFTLDYNLQPEVYTPLLLPYLLGHAKDIWPTISGVKDRLAFAISFRRLGSPYAEAITPDMVEDLCRDMGSERHLHAPWVIAVYELDPQRTVEWLRSLVLTSPPAARWDADSRIQVLKRLLADDPARHIDIAAAFAREPLTRDRFSHEALQQTGLEMAYRYDAVTFRPLLAEALLGRNEWIVQHALKLVLDEGNSEATRATLQRYLAGGKHKRMVAEALNWLLDVEWPDKTSYALSLFSHRSDAVRALAITWLARQGGPLVTTLAPRLRERNKTVRLAAAHCLAQIGGERAITLLRAHLPEEQAPEVLQGILELLGALPPAIPSHATLAAPTAADAAADGAGEQIAALSARAEAAARRPGKPPCPWFDAAIAPAPRWITGDPLPAPVIAYLLRCQGRMIDAALALEVLEALPLIDHASAGDFAVALAQAWHAHAASYGDIIYLPLASALGDDRIIAEVLDREIPRRGGYETRRRYYVLRLKALEPLGSDAMLDAIYRDAPRPLYVENAALREVFRGVAARRGISPEELLDACTTLFRGHRGADGSYRAHVPVADERRTVVVRLGHDWKLHCSDENDVELDTVALPHPQDPPAQIFETLRHLPADPEAIARELLRTAQRLETALATRRTWEVAAFERLFLHHPVLSVLATGLVWGVVAPAPASGDRLARAIPPLPAMGRSSTQARTVCSATSRGVRSLLPQMDRPTYSVEADERDVRTLQCPPQASSVPRPDLWSARLAWYVEAEGQGWEKEDATLDEQVDTVWKAFPDLGVEAVLQRPRMEPTKTDDQRHEPWLGFVCEGTVPAGTKDRRILARDDVRLLPLGQVPAIAYSEAQHDVAVFAVGGRYHRR
jgi:Domain of unknown function (DUF4132)/HEAT repeats